MEGVGSPPLSILRSGQVNWWIWSFGTFDADMRQITDRDVVRDDELASRIEDNGMKIAILSTPHVPTPPRGYGASETIAGHVSRGLVSRGHQVKLFGAEGSTGASTITWYPEARTGNTFDGRELIHVAKALADIGDCDIVHNHCVAAGPPLAALCARPFFTTVHYQHPMIRAFPRARYVAVSHDQARRLARDVPKIDLIGTVHNGVNLDEFSIGTARGDHLVFLGRFHPNKAADLAIEAATIAERRLVIAAPAPPPDQVDWFESYVAPKLGRRIEWIGPVDAPARAELFASAAATLVPLRWDEPFGLVMAESMASGTPVIAFRRGAAPEVVDDEVTGFLVDDVRTMAEAVDRCAAIDPWTCRRRVVERFSVDRMVDSYLKLYQDYLMRA